MSSIAKTMNVPATGTAGTEIATLGLMNKRIHVGALAGGTEVRIQGRVGPASAGWTNIGAANVTAAGFVATADLADHWTALRVNRAVVGDGAAVVVTLIGTHDPR